MNALTAEERTLWIGAALAVTLAVIAWIGSFAAMHYKKQPAEWVTANLADNDVVATVGIWWDEERRVYFHHSDGSDELIGHLNAYGKFVPLVYFAQP